MSDYYHIKAIRMKVSSKQLGVDSLYDIEDDKRFEELFHPSDKRRINRFEIAPTESEGGDNWGKARKLTEKELEKFLPMFKKIYPNATKNDLRYVEFCYYNCCEADDYFDVRTENFED